VFQGTCGLENLGTSDVSMTVQFITPPEHAPDAAWTGWSLWGCLTTASELREFRVTGPAFVIGRYPQCDLQIPSRCVSGRHAEIMEMDGQLFLNDLGSTNGTFLNRRKVQWPTPLASGDHIEIANVEFRVEFQRGPDADTTNANDSLKQTMRIMDAMEPDWIFSQFQELIEQQSVTPHYQPLVRLETGTTFGYEALARSSLPGLETPGQMFEAARLLNREVELSRVCRHRAIEQASAAQLNSTVFINTHPKERLDTDVLPSLVTIRNTFPDVPVVIELHEAAIQDPQLTRSFADQLKELDIKLAYDDFGAGQSRLLELVKTPPAFLKFDACLIRDIHLADPYQWRMLKMLVEMARDVSISTVAEGIECQEEEDACRDLGFDLVQGFHLGRPAPLPPADAPVSQSRNPVD
jgi:EAL domain-containing protein (putative c-di-GMP-specific phosphodiesterase class I)